MVDIDTIWGWTDSQRDALADNLSGLTEEQWTTPSLCAGWTVRDVAAHLAWQDVTLPQVLGPMLRARFNSDVLIRDTAKRSPLTHDEIVAKLRSFHGRRVKPPFVSDTEPLIDILVHTQDICVPLGIEHAPPVDAAIAAIKRTTQLNEGRMRLRAPLRDVRLVATDADWAMGAGRPVEGPLRFLLLAVAGREAAYSRLSGDVAALA